VMRIASLRPVAAAYKALCQRGRPHPCPLLGQGEGMRDGHKVAVYFFWEVSDIPVRRGAT
ncbi:MAG: hypothetical protein KGJ59_09580, partial [Bacteroidota bacterium]|nr:hypothetical protein [Bacteroidota bacterium]